MGDDAPTHKKDPGTALMVVGEPGNGETRAGLAVRKWSRPITAEVQKFIGNVLSATSPYLLRAGSRYLLRLAALLHRSHLLLFSPVISPCGSL